MVCFVTEGTMFALLICRCKNNQLLPQMPIIFGFLLFFNKNLLNKF